MTSAASPATQTIELAPSYALPLVLIVAAIPILLVQKWFGLALSFFGVFLLVQAATIRLQFTETALDIYRSGQMIRRFPYQEWLNWRIFWLPVPILFYFKEVRSIHFLSVLFDPKGRESCLEQRCPKI